MLTNLIVVLAAIFSAPQENDDSIDIFQKSFRVDYRNQLALILRNEIKAPEEIFFARTHNLASLLLDPEIGSQLDITKDDRRSIKAVLDRINRENDFSEVFSNPATGTQAEVSKLAEEDRQRYEELLGLLSEKKIQTISQRLQYKLLCQIGLVEWLHRHKALSPSEIDAIQQSVKSAEKELAEQAKSALKRHSESILAIIGKDKAESWQRLIGEDCKWLADDPFVQLCHTQADWKQYKVERTKSILETLRCCELWYSIDFNGNVSIEQDPAGVSQASLLLLVSDELYGGLELTKNQRTEVLRTMELPKEISSEIEEDLKQIRERGKRDGVAAIKDDLIKIHEKLVQTSFSQLEEAILEHQKEFLIEIAKRRVVSVCGVGQAFEILEHEFLANNPQLKSRLTREREKYAKEIHDIHQKYASTLWREINETVPEVKSVVTEMIPSFNYRDIKHPSMLFRVTHD
jgi:hypothetical protein